LEKIKVLSDRLIRGGDMFPFVTNSWYRWGSL